MQGTLIERIKQHENIQGYICISPWLIGYIIFTAAPMAAALALSFMQWEIAKPSVFIGLENYQTMFTADTKFWNSLWVTVYYVMGTVPIKILLSLFLAVLLSRSIFGTNIYRTVFYLPSVTSGVAVALVWTSMYSPDNGPVNDLLGKIGIEGPRWLASTDWAMPALIIMSFIYVGRYFVIFLAGLKGINRELYEVAQIDGAGPAAAFRHITLPMLSPSIFFNVVMAVILSFQVFSEAYVMTNGGPVGATWVYVYNIYIQAFQFLKLGYASALAWFLFVIIMALTIFQFKVSGWVYYEGGLRG
jgi:multiple sugar transport system permease protein